MGEIKRPVQSSLERSGPASVDLRRQTEGAGGADMRRGKYLRTRVATVSMLFASTNLSSARAQTVVDGSDADGNPRWISAVIELVASQLHDPMSAQFRKIRKTPEGSWCGQYNAKS